MAVRGGFRGIMIVNPEGLPLKGVIGQPDPLSILTRMQGGPVDRRPIRIECGQCLVHLLAAILVLTQTGQSANISRGDQFLAQCCKRDSGSDLEMTIHASLVNRGETIRKANSRANLLRPESRVEPSLVLNPPADRGDKRNIRQSQINRFDHRAEFFEDRGHQG